MYAELGRLNADGTRIESAPVPLNRLMQWRLDSVGNANMTPAVKTGGSPIDQGLSGPGLLAHMITSRFADFLPLNRLHNMCAREGFELDRSTLCLWLADVARLVRPLYRRMVQGVLQSHVLATDDAVLPPRQADHPRVASSLAGVAFIQRTPSLGSNHA